MFRLYSTPNKPQQNTNPYGSPNPSLKPQINDKPEDDKNEEEDEDKSAFDKSHLKYYLVAIGGSILLSSYFIQQVYTTRNTQVDSSYKEGNANKLTLGGDWRLVDKANNSISSEDLEGSYYIIYFGFCKCPDFCPQTLSRLSRVLKTIKLTRESSYFDLKVVFVSIDPDRDTPEVIEKYLKDIAPGVVGISGTSNDDPKLKEMMKKFKIYATKIATDSPNDSNAYTFDHSIIGYLMDDENRYLTHIGPQNTTEEASQRVIDYVMEHENEKYDKREAKKVQKNIKN